ncbi:MAG TPA: YfiR family protein, partial [Bryobacteraceae bacterium]
NPFRYRPGNSFRYRPSNSFRAATVRERSIRYRNVLLCFALAIGALAAADQPQEYQVKAAFLLNFTKFIDWPATAFGASDSPVAICILGDDPFGAALDQIVEGEVVDGRKISVQRIKRAPPPKSCQVLFAGKPEKAALKILPGLGPGVLTVSEGESFARSGGMIAFVIENRRVRFDINLTVAENAGLKLSSKLLSVARTVEK